VYDNFLTRYGHLAMRFIFSQVK